MTRLPKLALVAPAAMALTLGLAQGQARADLITTVTATVTEIGSMYQYVYNVQNSAGSTASVGEFDLDVSASATLTSISATTGFLALYTAGDSTMTFDSTDPSTDIAPGATGTFSFMADVPPVLGNELGRSFGDGTTSSGTVLTPTGIPEPSVVALSALGALALFAPRALRRRAR